ncbi:hypothetical protein [Roseateles violae]|uniref:J domain-containing protein n=1 Tax=Roseateles violae TaxID=3058042 RepID=A0ABT8DZE3_9BURK|nr:hypothetical protein [Pelomonas sp. PFR6]MDN3922967.1 hypothetical protein [Pelomonas sp. PFR6]
MMNTAITRQELERRRSQLRDLQSFLADQEQEFALLRGRIQVFVDRYTDLLGPLYMELDALESQLHCATSYLAEALRRNGVAARSPKPPRATELPRLPQLPGGAPLPPEPKGGLVELGPPTLKTLYRRAAMRLHPDLAPSERERRQREQQMMIVNEAYAAGDRRRLESLLLAAGEEPLKVHGGNADAVRDWLSRSEQAVQGRLRVVQAHLALLKAHAMHQMWQAIAAAEAQQLDPLAVMASRLRAQIAERRQELYIGQRLQPDSGLAQAFLHRRVERMGASSSAH